MFTIPKKTEDFTLMTIGNTEPIVLGTYSTFKKELCQHYFKMMELPRPTFCSMYKMSITYVLGFIPWKVVCLFIPVTTPPQE